MATQMEGQMTIFDFLGESPVTNKIEAFNPLLEFAKRGSGFVGGKSRILNKFAETLDKKERVIFLAKEYGVGGFGSPRTGENSYQLSGADWCTPMARKKIRLTWYVPGEFEEHEELYTFEQLHDAIAELIYIGEY